MWRTPSVLSLFVLACESGTVVEVADPGYGYGHVLDASGFRDLDDEVTRYSTATGSAVASGGNLGAIGPSFADHTGGDGRDELIADAPGYEDGGRLYFLTQTS